MIANMGASYRKVMPHKSIVDLILFCTDRPIGSSNVDMPINNQL